MTVEDLLVKIKERFDIDREKFHGLSWSYVEERLINNKDSLKILLKMEEAGGEVSVVRLEENGTLTFFDTCKECSKGRNSFCYDKEARESRKKNKPLSSAEEEAAKLGSSLLDEEDYIYLQSLGDFDLKGSCWLLTPKQIRDRGGAIFGDKRFSRAFIYHNGAESYYSSRGYRTKISI